MAKETYKNDKVIRRVSSPQKPDLSGKIADSKPPSDFKSNLSAELKKIDFGSSEGDITLIFESSKGGNLVCQNAYGILGFTDNALLAIINAITNSPPWKPAYINGEAVEQKIPIYINVPSLEIRIGLSIDGKKYMENFDSLTQ